MPNGFDATQIPAAHVPILEKDSTKVSREWYRYLYNLFVLTGSGSNTATLLDLQYGPPTLMTAASSASPAYGSFFDTTTQNPASINTAYPITLNSTDLSSGVYIGSPTSRIYVTKAGVYNFQFSLQLISGTAAAKLVYVWARINGIDQDNSATKVTIQGSSAAVVAAWNFVYKLAAGDYFELVYSANSTNVQIYAETATSPVPAIPSVILTVTDNIGE